MLNDVLVTDEDKELTPKDVEALINDAKSASSKELNLTRAALDNAALQGLCKYLEETTCLQSFVFNGTLLSIDGRNQLLEALVKNKSLQKVFLSHCLLSDSNKSGLENLIKQHPTIRFLDISSHSFSSTQSIETAIVLSKSLILVVGLTLSENTQKALEKNKDNYASNAKSVLGSSLSEPAQRASDQNKRINALKTKLASWQDEDNQSPPSQVILEVRKNLFYKEVNVIRLNNKKDKARLNPILADFYWYLAQEYQRAGLIEEAQKYFDRFITFHPVDSSKQFQALWEMMNMYFTSAAGIKPDLELSEAELMDLNTTQSLYFIKAADLFKKAQDAAQTKPEKEVIDAQAPQVIPVISEHLIEKGETALIEVNNGSDRFKRKYKRIDNGR